jgi:hypothetical protein
LGVYLAGYVGFQRTLEYERFVKAQQRSERLTALHEELKQNVVRLLKFNERLPADVGNNVHDPDWPHLLLFVWQAAGRSVSAADIPPQIVIDRTQFRERLENHMKFAEASIFPAMDEATNASAELLKKYASK